MPRTMKIIAVDFDGTLYTGDSTPWPQVDATKMNMDLINYIEKCQAKYPQDKYILWTCRENDEVEFALEALNKVSTIRWDAVNQNVLEVKSRYGDPRKIIADVYIDDKVLTPNKALTMFEIYLQEGNE